MITAWSHQLELHPGSDGMPAGRQVLDEFQPHTQSHTKHVIVCGNEAAALVDNEFSGPDGSISIMSIDTYLFTAEGGCVECNYMDTG